MAADKQLFAPMPLRAMAADLSGLQLRILACVAAHDRMSLPTGKGQGCRASNDRIRQMVACSFARACSTLSELVELGFLQREKLGRHTVYRVVYTDNDRLLFGNVSTRTIGCGSGSEEAPIGCRDIQVDGGKLPETASQYIPLNGGIDSEESGEENSSEEARLSARRLCKVSLADNACGQLARFERAWKADPDQFDLETLEQWSEYLDQTQEAFECGDPEYGQAERLADVIGERLAELRNRPTPVSAAQIAELTRHLARAKSA